LIGQRGLFIYKKCVLLFSLMIVVLVPIPIYLHK